jgi:hypothetical protein
MFENRNPNDLINNVIKESYIINLSASFDNDIDSYTETGNTTQNNGNQKLLKGILKNTDINLENERRIGVVVVKICTSALVIITMAPIIVCDIYFGFNDNSCVNEMPNGFNITMKAYLLVSGFAGVACLLAIIYTIWSRSNDDNNIITSFYLKTIGIIIGLFQLMWNILGAVTFWKTIYKGGNCDLMISTYIYVSLIIKLIINSFVIGQNSMKKKCRN